MPDSSNDRLDQLREAFSTRYEVLDLLGQGGMATVYRARDLRHGRDVAVKIFDSELTGSIGAQRFRREIETAAGFVHPNILTVHDSGRVGDLLYYVMPYVEGESLRDRIERTGPLEPKLALRIAHDVADALANAHARGVVHRDIKPGNILLAAGDHAWVADFGIARALSPSEGEAITTSGVFLGTPLYMSPEQSSSAQEIDGRTDQYSLGCVLYEMLTGKPPFPGRGAVLLSAKIRGLPRAPGLLESVVSDDVAAIVRKTLSPAPEKRYESAAAFATALAEVVDTGRSTHLTPSSSTGVRWVRRMLAGRRTLVLAVVAVVLGLFLLSDLITPAGGTSTDPTRYLVLPFTEPAGELSASGVESALRDALARWRDISLADPVGTGSNGESIVDVETARDIAMGLGAGRFITGEVVGSAPDQRVRAFLHDVALDRPIATATVAMPEEGRERAMVRLSDELLFPEATSAQQDEMLDDPGTAFVVAMHAYLAGLANVDRLNLVQADSAFGAAVFVDPEFRKAHLWTSQIALWLGKALTVVEASAGRALRDSMDLSPRNRRFARAAMLMGRSQFPAACAVYDSLTHDYPYDFAPWFGIGECTRRDNVLVRDTQHSPSGWSFRSSYHRSTDAFRQAFLLLGGTTAAEQAASPRLLSGFREHDFQRVREVLFATGQYREGRTPAGESFFAGPVWQGDTLAFIPYPVEEVFGGRSWTYSPTRVQAVENQRRVFRGVTAAWSSANPGSLDVLEAVVVALELIGDRTAIDTLMRARAIASDPADEFRLAAKEAVLSFKFSIPDNLAGLDRAHELADSLLGDDTHARDQPAATAALAALLGRPHVMADASREISSLRTEIPAAYRAEASTLIAYAAYGGPVDSLRALESRLERSVQGRAPGAATDHERFGALGRAARLALPVYTFQIVRDGVTIGDYMLVMADALLRNDTSALRFEFDRRRNARRAVPAADRTVDALLVEAWILAESGRVHDAVDWLDPTLEALRFTQPWGVSAAPIMIAMIIRAAELRAELADQIGDQEAWQRWSQAVAHVRR
jgi:serine/threonine protein kinase